MALGLFFAIQQSGHALAGGTLLLLDDNGEALKSRVEVCFRTGLARDCQAIVPPNHLVPCPEGFTAVRVEGPDYGPIQARRRELPTDDSGNYQVNLPRKALLQIDGLPAKRLTVSVYRASDLEFRAPYFRTQLEGSPRPHKTRLKIPAGELLLSLAVPGYAPDLHLLTALPNKTHLVKYKAVPGWSLVLRTTSATYEHGVGNAHIEVASLEEYRTSDEGAKVKTTGASGLALYSGIVAPVVQASIEHPDYVARAIRAISASPGTFDFQEVELERGGTLRAEITVNGEPGAGLHCRAIEAGIPSPGSTSAAPPGFEGTTNDDGICRSSRLPSGWYTLEVSQPSGQKAIFRLVLVVNEEETSEPLELRRIRVRGGVYRGTDPVANATVRISRAMDLPGEAGRGQIRFVAGPKTDDNGEYEADLWETGVYYFSLRDSGAPGAAKRVEVSDDEETVDFNLDSQGLIGTVADEQGAPIERAAVGLYWNDSQTFVTHTDPEGAFVFPVHDEGTAVLTVHRVGYRSSSPLEVQVAPDAPRPPLIIQLERALMMRAVLTSTGGAVAGAKVVAGRLPAPRIAWSDENGRFDIAIGEGQLIRLFVSGQGCPLTHFDVRLPNDLEELVPLVCAPAPTSLLAVVHDTDGQPVQNATLLLRRDGVPIPQWILTSHQARLGVPQASDGAGRLTLTGLAPGRYDLFLAGKTSEELIGFGSSQGYLTTVQLDPLATKELAIVLEVDR